MRLGTGIKLFAAGMAMAAGPVAARADLPGGAATVNAPWSITMASEVRYYSWKGTRGSPAGVSSERGSGTQIYVPYALQLVGMPHGLLKVELLGRGGWVRARQSTGGLSGDVSTATDTVVSGTATYLGVNGIQPFVSLSANLPTGKSALMGSAANARMDPDLVEISTFGEGWNVGPTLGFNLPLTSSFIVTASAGYTWRGAFNRENSLVAVPGTAQSLTSIDPGDVFTATLALGYSAGPWSAKLTASVSEETTTAESGVALYKAGRRYLAHASLSYSQPEFWGVTTLNASIAHSNRNQVRYAGAPDLLTETLNANANVYRLGLEHLVPVGALWLGPTGSYLHRDNNSYNSMTLQNVPAKDRYSAGLVARYAASDTVTFNLRAEHVWVRENERLAINGQQFSVYADAFVLSPAVPVVSSTGWQIAGGFNIKF
ncbi:MAG TPA: hypothetical protein VNR39_12005 [Pseudolabrys sp.]|nr:hypothetical protein [Pseudolabrys sp.]